MVDEDKIPDDMALDFHTLLRAALFVTGLVWLHATWIRLLDDIQSFRATDNPLQRRTQILVWIVSAGIILGVIAYVGGLLRTLVRGMM